MRTHEESLSCPQKAAKIDDVRPEVMAFELEALSMLLHFWASNPDKERQKSYEGKIPLFRSAVIGVKGSGARQAIPSELVMSEYNQAAVLVAWVREAHKKVTETKKLAETIQRQKQVNWLMGEFKFCRPLPIPEYYIKSFCNDIISKAMTPSEIQRNIVAVRLGCSESTVKKTLAKEKQRKKIEITTGTLCSVFLDLCSLPKEEMPCRFLAKILNTLLLSKCDALVMLYLIQACNAKPLRKFFGEYDYSEIDYLCDMLSKKVKEIRFEPFLRLVD